MSISTIALTTSSMVFSMAGLASAATLVQYNFDAAPTESGTQFADISGNANHVTFGAAPAVLSDDPFANAFSNSVGQSSALVGSINSPSALRFDTNGEFTLEGWLKPAVDEFTGSLIQVRDNTGGLRQIAELGLVDGKATARLYGLGDVWVSSTATLAAGVWSHIAAVYSSATLSIYVDGVLANQQAIGAALSSHADTAYVGHGSFGFFNGAFDDVRISDVALDPSELGVHQSFTTVPEPAAAGLIAMAGVAFLRRRRV